MRRGEYISFNSKEHGIGEGRVLDIIETKGKLMAIVEPLYGINERKNRDTLIRLSVSDIKKSSNSDIEERISMR